MVVRIDDLEPNVFPAIEATDVTRPADGRLDVVLIIRIDGKASRVRVRLERSKALKLSEQLIAALTE